MDAAHTPLLIVHLKVVDVPTVIPVTVVVGEFDEVMVAEPVTILQLPVPTVAVLPAKVVDVALHKF